MNKCRYSRRELMKWSASALLAANLWPGKLWAADKATESFDFIIVNDLHVRTDDDGPWLEKVVASMKAVKGKPLFCFIAGDLADNSDAKQFGVVNTAFKGLDLPIYTVPGNHDFGNDDTAYDTARPKSRNYVFEQGGWQFMALDSTEGTKATAKIQKPTLDLVDETLPNLDKSKPLLLVTHFPQGPGVKMRSENADALLDRFKPYNLCGVFGGHYHAYTQTTVRDIPIKTNKCCSLTRGNHDGSKEKGYFLCSTKDAKVTPEFVEMK